MTPKEQELIEGMVLDTTKKFVAELCNLTHSSLLLQGFSRSQFDDMAAEVMKVSRAIVETHINRHKEPQQEINS